MNIINGFILRIIIKWEDVYCENILFIASEGVPFIKTGGLADVVDHRRRALI